MRTMQKYGRLALIISALLFTSHFVRSHSPESSEEPRKLKIDLNALKNAAEVVRIVKAMNEGGEHDSLQQEEGYGKQEEKSLQGIDIDYLGENDDRHQNIREILELIQKNRDAKEKHDLTKSELIPRVYFISNPEVLDKYREKIMKENERDSQTYSGSYVQHSSEKGTGINNLWEILNTMRREGDADKRVYPLKMMIHPRLLHLNLERDVPSIGEVDEDKNEKEGKITPYQRFLRVVKDENNDNDEDKNEKEEKITPYQQFLRVVKDENNDNDAMLANASDNFETTKNTFSLEITETTEGYQFYDRDDDMNDKSNTKKDSSENKSEDNYKKITKIDFKAKSKEANYKEEELDDKSLESYKPRKKYRKEKGESKFDDGNDDFMRKSIESYNSPKNKVSKFDDKYATGYSKNKRNRWEKQEDKRNKWEKKGKFEEKIKFKPPKSEPRKEERNNEMNRPRIKPHISRPIRNQMSKLFGRTPVPVVGKKGIYEDD